ncbi:MAG: hypothetical protein JWO89_2642, partial [Verrucomicrobiaceae bacterium]|nr:hypothetical protein [Verrucomicrobiaceae bacterium]
MKRRALLSCLLVASVTLSTLAEDAKIKVACVGDSITAGVGTKKPHNSYPD